MRILVEGWISILHSYSIVNIFQLYNFAKYYPEVEIVFRKTPYPVHTWERLDSSTLFPKYILDFLKTLKKWNPNDRIDLIYRLMYPYNMDPHPKNIPIVIFMTMEFARPNLSMFVPRMVDHEMLRLVMTTYRNLHLVTPSYWSLCGLEQFSERNTVIPHGVDLDIYYPLDNREELRKQFNIPDECLVFLHAGAMTKSKGVYEALYLVFRLVVQQRITNIRLVLKCSDELYISSKYISYYLNAISEQESIPYSVVKQFEKNHVIYKYEMFSFQDMNRLYNACDVYIAPYSGEGFNMIPLEVLASGGKVILTDGGATDIYTYPIAEVCRDAVLLLPSKEVIHDSKYLRRQVNLPQSFEQLQKNISALSKRLSKEQIDRIRNVIENRFSWRNIARMYMEYFKRLILDSSRS